MFIAKYGGESCRDVWVAGPSWALIYYAVQVPRNAVLQDNTQAVSIHVPDMLHVPLRKTRTFD